jgi:uncharacterized protein (TIGR00661 family)
MKVIYGLSGQGFGHSARSKETIKHLIAAGHEVKIFTYGQSLFMLEKDFHDQLFEIPGFILSYKNNRLVYWKTIMGNAKRISRQAKDWSIISKEFSRFNPDIVITDFEPLTAMLARVKHKPLISIDNQHQLTNTKIKVDKKHFQDFLTDKLVVKSIIWGAKYYLITSFFKTPITKKNTFLFAPIIRSEVLDLQPTDGDYILVYEGADFDLVEKVLGQLDYKFLVVGPSVKPAKGNLTFKKFSTEEWLKDLAAAKAVVGTAGLSLICECIYLKKPYFALPIAKQVEQIINAEQLKALGLGEFSCDLKPKELIDFINNLGTYKTNLQQADNCGNQALFKKLDEIIEELKKRK